MFDPSPSFAWDILSRSVCSFLSWLGTTGPGFIVGNILAVVLTLVVTHFARNAAGDMKETAAKDLKIGLIVYAIVFVTLFVPIFGYHLFFVVPAKIRAQADSSQAPPVARQYLPPIFWNIKSPHPVVRQPVVRLIFKRDSAFTPEREQKITQIIDQFHRYLIGFGFNLASDVPPLVVRNVISMSWMTPGTVYDAQLGIPLSGIDDPDTVRNVYALWVFRQIFERDAPNSTYSLTQRIASLYSCYYRSSFVNKNVCNVDWDGRNWVKALLEIRRQQGKDFTDRVMFYTVAAWESPVHKPEDLNDLFAFRFLKGVFVLDQSDTTEIAIREVLTSYGLMPQN